MPEEFPDADAEFGAQFETILETCAVSAESDFLVRPAAMISRERELHDSASGETRTYTFQAERNLESVDDEPEVITRYFIGEKWSVPIGPEDLADFRVGLPVTFQQKALRRAEGLRIVVEWGYDCEAGDEEGVLFEHSMYFVDQDNDRYYIRDLDDSKPAIKHERAPAPTEDKQAEEDSILWDTVAVADAQRVNEALAVLGWPELQMSLTTLR